MQYLTCEFKSREERHAFKSHIEQAYVINMVFDSNIIDENFVLRPLDTYRGNFLKGELVINK